MSSKLSGSLITITSGSRKWKPSRQRRDLSFPNHHGRRVRIPGGPTITQTNAESWIVSSSRDQFLGGFARRRSLAKTQRRKEKPRDSAALCVFASLREIFFRADGFIYVPLC